MTRFSVPLLGALACGLLLLGACDDKAGKAAEDGKDHTEHAAVEPDREAGLIRLSPDEARRAGIKIIRVESGEWQDTAAVFGTIVANQNRIAKIVPPIAGRLTRIEADLGDQVQAGAPLAVLDSPELGEARSAFEQAQVELGLARATHDRMQRLLADKAVAQKDELQAKAQYEKAQAAAMAARARLTNLGAAVGAPAGGTAASLIVTAPFAGTVVEKTAVLGEYAQPYQPLFTVADLSTVWVEANIYERDIAAIAAGAPATLTVAAYPNQRFAGRVTYISSLLDRETRTAKARIEAPNRDGRLKPGMFADVLIEKSTRSGPALRVPESALVLLQGQMTAFVKTEDGFAPRPVETGPRAGGEVVIAAGLERGDEVVESGAFALKARLLKAQIGDVD
jgi:cobalt-zinc-cadmium efflux system membrane fusion protein